MNFNTIYFFYKSSTYIISPFTYNIKYFHHFLISMPDDILAHI